MGGSVRGALAVPRSTRCARLFGDWSAIAGKTGEMRVFCPWPCRQPAKRRNFVRVMGPPRAVNADECAGLSGEGGMAPGTMMTGNAPCLWDRSGECAGKAFRAWTMPVPFAGRPGRWGMRSCPASAAWASPCRLPGMDPLSGAERTRSGGWPSGAGEGPGQASGASLRSWSVGGAWRRGLWRMCATARIPWHGSCNEEDDETASWELGEESPWRRREGLSRIQGRLGGGHRPAGGDDARPVGRPRLQ